MDTKVIGLVAQWTMSDAMSELDKLNNFNVIFNVIRAKKGRQELVDKLREHASTIKLNSRKAMFKRDLTLAENYVVVASKLNHTYMDMNSIRQVGSLVKHITTNFSKELDEVLNKLEEVHQVGRGAVEYNNAIGILCRKLRSEHKVTKTVTYNNVVDTVESLELADKEKLLALLMEELGYEVEREVA